MPSIGSCVLVLLTAVLHLGCTACSMDTRRRVVSSPAENGIVLAPDLDTLTALMGQNPPPLGKVVSIPNGTKGLSRDRKFLRGGKLVNPYPANTYDMGKDGAVEVEFFEVTAGPNRGSKGWVQASFLRPDFWFL